MNKRRMKYHSWEFIRTCRDVLNGRRTVIDELPPGFTLFGKSPGRAEVIDEAHDAELKETSVERRRNRESYSGREDSAFSWDSPRTY